MFTMCVVLALALVIVALSRRSFSIEEFQLNARRKECAACGTDKMNHLALVEITPGYLPALLFRRLRTFRWAYSIWGTEWGWCEWGGALFPKHLNDLLAARWQQEQVLAEDATNAR